MAAIRQSLDISGGVIPFLIIAIYKTTSPTIEVDRVVYTNSVSPLPFQYQFIDLDNGTYIVKVYESPDGVTLGNNRHDFWVDALTNTVVGEKKYYVGDGVGEHDPEAPATSVTDPYFEGRTIAGVFKEGFRFLREAIEYERVDNTINLLRGATVEHDEVLFVELSAVVALPDGGSAAIIDPYDRVLRVSAATYNMLDTDLLHTLSCVVSSGLVQTVNMVFAGSMGEGNGVVIRHDGGAVNVELRMKAGETALFLGQLVNVIYLGVGEWVKIVSTAYGLIVTAHSGQWDRLGRREGADNIPIVAANQIPALAGTTYDGLIYKRLKAYVDLLPANRKVSIAAKATYANRGFWGVTGNNIVPPYMDGMVIKFNGQLVMAPGAYETDQNKSHNHTPTDTGNLDNVNPGLIGYLPPGRSAPVTVNQVDATAFEPNVRATPIQMVNEGGDQVRVRSISQIPVILI